MAMNGDDKLQVVLTVNEWNLVLTMLAKQPYEMSADLIMSIRQQAQNQANAILQQQNAALAAEAAKASNGLGPLTPVPPAIDFGQERE